MDGMKYKLSHESGGYIRMAGLFDTETEAREFASILISSPVSWGDNDWDSHLGRYDAGCFTVCPFIRNPLIQPKVAEISA